MDGAGERVSGFSCWITTFLLFHSTLQVERSCSLMFYRNQDLCSHKSTEGQAREPAHKARLVTHYTYDGGSSGVCSCTFRERKVSEFSSATAQCIAPQQLLCILCNQWQSRIGKEENGSPHLDVDLQDLNNTSMFHGKRWSSHGMDWVIPCFCI